MPILEGDIKILQSQVLDDVPEGGGMATGQAVVDGLSNNLFPDISELDRTYGRIALRKVYPAVVTDDTDAYSGAHVIVAGAPADPRVSATIFTTKSWTDQRTAAASKLESYLAIGAEARFTLYGNHLAGQRGLQWHCSKSTPSPSVGDVYCLVKLNNPDNSQYVRITRIISRVVDQVFTDQYGDYLRDVIAVEISDPLRMSFDGAPITRYTETYYNPPTRIHNAFAADAASYFGISPIARAAQLGDLTLSVESIYTQLVPSALSESPIVDARIAGARDLIVPIAGAPAISFSSALSTAPGAVVTRYFGRGIARGSVSIAIGGVTLTDNANGAITAASGYTGSVDYASGAVALARSTGIGASATYTAAPAAAVAQATHTDATPISIGNRGYTYVKSLSPAPAPGSVSIEYMALGRWYRLEDNGAGGISGDDGVGSGAVNYATGSVMVTLGALPDVATQILFSWGTPAHFTAAVGSTVFRAPAITVVIPGGALQPTTVTVSYLAGSVARTVTDNGAGGMIGDCTGGYIDYANGRIIFLPSVLPDGGSTVTTTYRNGALISEVHTAGGASSNFSLGHAVMPKSLTLTFSDPVGGTYIVRDDGAGSLHLAAADFSGTGSGSEASGNPWGGAVTSASVTLGSTAGVGGSINYATGAVALGGQIVLNATTQSRSATGNPIDGTWQVNNAWSTASQTVTAAGAIQAAYRQAGDPYSAAQTHTQTVDAVTIDLLPTTANTLVPGSLRFFLNGDIYVDRAGTIVRNPSALTNSGTVAGVVNYATGSATLEDWAGGGAPSITVECLTRKGLWDDFRFRFRLAGAPVQPASLAVRVNRAADSVQISANANLAGDITGAQAGGSVDVQYGIVDLRFGTWVADASLSPQEKSEWWYNAANIVGGAIFRPVLVLADTAFYNAVAVSNLPLSADVLGIDPVRLPVDGRVPIFRKGDVLVVHHQAVTSPATVTNGQTLNLGRVRIARIRVIGDDEVTISAGYTTDLDAGTVTFNSVAGYAQPVRVEHRIEDMALCSDVQINGDLQITRPLTHDFPLGSMVSSALIAGDMRARVSHFFDQETWTGAWSDTIIGSGAPSSYNAVQYPVVVTNKGAIKERWRLVFTNTNTISVIGETIGQVLTAVAIANPIAPINPATSVPYFTIAPGGWGAGWSAGNVLRLNTVAATYPVWVARTVLQGPAAVQDDAFILGVRGDVDTP